MEEHIPALSYTADTQLLCSCLLFNIVFEKQ